MTLRSNDTPVASSGSRVARSAPNSCRGQHEGGEKSKTQSETCVKAPVSGIANVNTAITANTAAYPNNGQTMDRKPPAVATPPKEPPPRGSRRNHRRDADTNDDAIAFGSRPAGYRGNNLTNDMNLSFSPGPAARAAMPVARASAATAMASNHAALAPPEPPVAWPPQYPPPTYHPPHHGAWKYSYAPPSKKQKAHHHFAEHPRIDHAKKAGRNRPGKYRDYSHLGEDDVLENLLFLSSSSEKKRPSVVKTERAGSGGNAPAGDAVDFVGEMDSKQCAKNKGNESDEKQPAVDSANIDTSHGLVAFANNSTFPMKLHQILSTDEHSNAVVWLTHGRAWKVVSMDALEREVLPKFFNHRRRESFRRQVDCWNFRRIVRGADAGAYYHEKFLRGMPHISLLMSESKKNKRSTSHSKMLDILPHYYAVSRANPLPEPGRTNPPTNRDNGNPHAADQHEDSIRYAHFNQMPDNNNGEENHPTIVAADATSPSSSEGDSFSTLHDDNPPDFYANPMPPCIIADTEEKTVESDVTDEEECERRRAAAMARQWYDQHNQWASSFYNGFAAADLNAFYQLQFGNNNNICPSAGAMAFAPPASMMPTQYPGYTLPPAPGAYPPVAYMHFFPPSMAMASGFPPPPPHAYHQFYFPAAAVYAPPPAGYAAYHHHVYHNLYPQVGHVDSNVPVNHRHRTMPGGAPPAPHEDAVQSNAEWGEMPPRQEAEESDKGNGFESL